MATLPSVFFGQYASGNDLAFLLSNVPPGSGPNYLFDLLHNGPATPSGDDEIFEVGPNQNVQGGGGYDVVVQSSGDLALDPSVEAGVLTGGLDGGIFGNDENNNLVGNTGDNLLKGKDGNDVLIGNDGDDKLIGGEGKDILSGGKGDDVLEGKDSKDELFGLGGDDKLFGADGKDSLIGGGGRDTLFGGAQRDTLTGDDGKDVFGFLKGEKGVDVITDFEKGDKIDLSDFNTDFDKLKFKDTGDDVVITVGYGKNAVKFKLLGYSSNDIDGSFFHF